MSLVLPDRLAELATLSLDDGSHDSFEAGHCAMELVSWLAGEPFSDHPECACPVIGAFVMRWNDALPDEDRNRLLRDLLPRVVGTRDPAKEVKRSLMAADWLVRVQTPAWLRLAGLTEHADRLAGLPEITDMAQVPSIKPAIEAARDDARAARDAAWDAAWDAAKAAARDAARAAARDAAWDAAWDAAKAAARDAAGHAARAAAWDAAWDAAGHAAAAAARAAARDAAGHAARDALKPTVVELQESARDFLVRMIEA